MLPGSNGAGGEDPEKLPTHKECLRFLGYDLMMCVSGSEDRKAPWVTWADKVRGAKREWRHTLQQTQWVGICQPWGENAWCTLQSIRKMILTAPLNLDHWVICASH